MLKKADMPLIAFVTAYDEYAVRAFEVNAVDYLLKPVDKTRLREALNRVQERIEHAEIVAEQSERIGDAIAAYESSPKAPFLERIPIRRRDEILILPVAQIASVIAEGELLYLTTIRNERHAIHLSAEGSGGAPRSRQVHPSGAGHAGEPRPDREAQRDAGRHARRGADQRAEAAGEPVAVADHPRAVAEIVD